MQKIFISLMWFIFCSNMAYSQGKLVFDYDQSGNQTKRTYACVACTALSMTSNENLIGLPVESDAESDGIEVYPNPTYDILNVNLKQEYKGKITAIQVYSNGTLYSEKLLLSSVQEPLTINLSFQSPGVYILTFYMTDGSIISKKIIKL